MPKKETIAITTPHVAGDEDIGEIRNIVGFHIRLAHGAVYRHFTETFADLDLTQKQVSALWLVATMSAWMRPRTSEASCALACSGSANRDITTPTWPRQSVLA